MIKLSISTNTILITAKVSKMLEINIENRTIKGMAKARDIKTKGLIEASIEHEQNKLQIL